MLETVLQATMKRSHVFGFLWGLGLIRLAIGVVVAIVLIWLLLKLGKLADAYTKKLK
jgi:hypothetical protein